MKRSNYALYRAIKIAAISNQESFDSYAESLEFAAEMGYGLLDGSIDWDSLEVDEADFWLEAFGSEPFKVGDWYADVHTDVGPVRMFPAPREDNSIPAGAMVVDRGYGPTPALPDHPKGWEGVLEAELAASTAPEVGYEEGYAIRYDDSKGTRRIIRKPLELEEGDEVLVKFWVEGSFYLVVESKS